MTQFVYITGATAGFGEACAHIFAKNGWNIVATGRREDRLEKLKSLIESQYSVECVINHYDVRDQEQVERSIESLPNHVKENLSILINNAGLAVGRGPIDTGVVDDWERMIDTNVKGMLYVTRAIVPFLKKHKPSHIINVASIAGKEVYPGGNVYCASKHAVDALSRAMRIDLVQYGVKVTNIAPGAADTEFSIVRFKGDQETADSVYQGYEPLKAEDIADVIYFAATRPAHVTLNDIVIMPTAQASAMVLHKD